MKLAADFRQEAREALRGKWPIAIVIGLVAALLGGAGSNGPEIKLNYDTSTGLSTTFDYAGQTLYSTSYGFDPRWRGLPHCDRACAGSGVFCPQQHREHRIRQI